MPSKSALIWVGLYVASLVMTWVEPIWGLMGVMEEYYRRPGFQWWGNELPRLRWNLIVTSIFALSVFVKRDQLPRVAEMPKATLGWLLAFAANLWFVTFIMAIDSERAVEWAVYFTKVALLMPLLLLCVLRTRRTIDMFILANVIGVAIWGWEAYTNPRREAARLIGIGSGDTLNDNFAAIHLLLILPLVVVMCLDAKTKVQRLTAVVALPLAINTLILCNSRGSMLGLAVGLAITPLLAKRGHRGKSLGVGLVMAGCLFVLADDQFFERQQTITSYEEDGSATGRLEGWNAARRILLDYPLGVGARGYHILIPSYSQALNERHDGEERAPHNTFVMIAVEYGVLGIFIWSMLLFSLFLMLYRSRRLALTFPDNYFYYRTVAVTVALASALVASLFTDRLYSEGIYWLGTLGIAVYRLAQTEHEAATASAQSAPRAA